MPESELESFDARTGDDCQNETANGNNYQNSLQIKPENYLRTTGD
jgi:hypothetical protein